MKKRLHDLGLIILLITGGIVVLAGGMAVFTLNIVLLPVSVIDLPIWILTGKTPIINFNSKLHTAIKDL